MSKLNAPFAIKVGNALDCDYVQRLAFEHGWRWRDKSAGVFLPVEQLPVHICFRQRPEGDRILTYCLPDELPADLLPLQLHRDRDEIEFLLRHWGEEAQRPVKSFNTSNVALLEELIDKYWSGEASQREFSLLADAISGLSGGRLPACATGGQDEPVAERKPLRVYAHGWRRDCEAVADGPEDPMVLHYWVDESLQYGECCRIASQPIVLELICGGKYTVELYGPGEYKVRTGVAALGGQVSAAGPERSI